jgi:hypothetical protein
MDVLNGTEPISGPHYFHKLKCAGDDSIFVYLLGEEHSNNHQCHIDGQDVGEVLRAAVSDPAFKVGVYLEMPQSYERNVEPNVVCTPRTEGTPRKDVLNTIRSCMLQKRNATLTHSSVKKRINFTDIREYFGLLPYTDRENSCMDEIRSEDADRARELLNQYFVSPISKALCTLSGVEEQFRELIYDKPEESMKSFEYFVYENWHRSLVPLAKSVSLHYSTFVHNRKRALGRILHCYRQMMDIFTDIYSTWRILSDIERGQVTHAVFYGGSSHAIAISELLRNMGFVTESVYKAPVNVACVRRKNNSS